MVKIISIVMIDVFKKPKIYIMPVLALFALLLVLILLMTQGVEQTGITNLAILGSLTAMLWGMSLIFAIL